MMKDSKVSIGIELRYRVRFKIMLAILKLLYILRMRWAAIALCGYVADDIQSNVDKYVIAARRD